MSTGWRYCAPGQDAPRPGFDSRCWESQLARELSLHIDDRLNASLHDPNRITVLLSNHARARSTWCILARSGFITANCLNKTTDTPVLFIAPTKERYAYGKFEIYCKGMIFV